MGDSGIGFEALSTGDCRLFRSSARNWPLRLSGLLQQYLGKTGSDRRAVKVAFLALLGRAGRHAGCQFMEPKRASLLFACREIQAGYVPAPTMNYNASAATSWFNIPSPAFLSLGPRQTIAEIIDGHLRHNKAETHRQDDDRCGHAVCNRLADQLQRRL